MDSVKQATTKAKHGLVGNVDQGGKRQVTLIEQEIWQDITSQFETSLDPSIRRANLLVSGIRLANTHNRVLRIGDCRIHIWGETRPCKHMDEAHSGLQGALADNWGGGAYGEVLDDGEIKVGDSVEWLE
jgi:MOSC domain-containing protein YiiM